jgi:hypothetical protein
MKKISILLLCLFCAYCLSAQNVSLKLNLTKGRVYKTTFKTNMVMIVGDTMKIPTLMDMYYETKVTKVEKNGDHLLTYTLKRVTMKMKEPKSGKNMDFDSDRKDNGAEEKAMREKFAEKLNKSFDVLYSSRGEILKGKEEAGSIGEFVLKLPLEPVKVGYKWSEKTSTNSSGIEMQTTSAYKVTEITATDVKVTNTGTIEIQGKKQSKPMTGSFTIDKTTGFIKEGKGSMEMDLGIMKMSMDIVMTNE